MQTIQAPRQANRGRAASRRMAQDPILRALGMMEVLAAAAELAEQADLPATAHALAAVRGLVAAELKQRHGDASLMHAC